MSELPRVVLKARRAKPFFARHPWVFGGAIAGIDGNPSDGDEVVVCSHADNFIAYGLYNSRSKITVRLYSWDSEQRLTPELWKSRIEKAYRFRKDSLHLSGPGSAYRLAFSEADGLSGCIIDCYDQWCAVQFSGLGIAQRKEDIVNALVEVCQPKGIYLRTEKGMGVLEGIELHDGLLYGEVPDHPIEIFENGLHFLVHLREGQKTGYYLDQRDNRQYVSRYASGRRVLDAFCYSGGFALSAARAGASEVIGVDGSEPALTLARQNAERNQISNVEFVQSDVFNYLSELVQQQQMFGMVILDPPKFARKRQAINEALRGYRRLWQLGIRLLQADGILVVCCCTGLITVDMLEELMGQLAEQEKRDIQILEHHGQAPDHPVSASCRESAYLKCFICRVV